MTSFPAWHIPGLPTGPGTSGPSADVYRDRFARALPFGEFVAAARKHPELWRDMAARARVPMEMVLRARELLAPRHLLVLLEDWCGDAINSVPYLDALASAVPQLDLRVLQRDRHPDLMDAHLSLGGRRAIPVVIVLDEQYQERGWWGSRPVALQQWFETPEAQAMTSGDRYREIRRWYARDRGWTTLSEVIDLLERSVVAGSSASISSES